MRRHGILCVDDEENILNALKRLFRKEPYDVFTARNAEAGLEAFRNNDVQLVICDHKMPGTTGIEFLSKIKSINPDPIRVVLSGFAEIFVVVEAINLGEVYRFLTKPWNDEDIKLTVKQCLEHYELTQNNQQLLTEIETKNAELSTLNTQLQQALTERTQSLSQRQTMFEDIPIPVLGITEDGRIALTNQALHHLLPIPDLMVGNHIEQSVDTKISKPILAFLESMQSDYQDTHQLLGKTQWIHAKKMYKNDSCIGCMITIVGARDE